MSQHVPEDLLAAFVDGDLDDVVAAHVAGHLDDCPACNARAIALDPLSSAFAAVDDPVIPAGLVAAVMAEARAPDRSARVELGVGFGLLGAACVMVLASGDVPARMIELVAFGQAALHGLLAVARGPAAIQGVLSLVTVVVVGASLVVTRAAFPVRRLT
jgi:anti-sigma factor RsiW